MKQVKEEWVVGLDEDHLTVTIHIRVKKKR